MAREEKPGADTLVFAAAPLRSSSTLDRRSRIGPHWESNGRLPGESVRHLPGLRERWHWSRGPTAR